jgi:hypothetical protein
MLCCQLTSDGHEEGAKLEGTDARSSACMTNDGRHFVCDLFKTRSCSTNIDTAYTG